MPTVSWQTGRKLIPVGMLTVIILKAKGAHAINIKRGLVVGLILATQLSSLFGGMVALTYL